VAGAAASNVPTSQAKFGGHDIPSLQCRIRTMVPMGGALFQQLNCATHALSRLLSEVIAYLSIHVIKPPEACP